jgi:hypothetical protein
MNKHLSYVLIAFLAIVIVILLFKSTSSTSESFLNTTHSNHTLSPQHNAFQIYDHDDHLKGPVPNMTVGMPTHNTEHYVIENQKPTIKGTNTFEPNVDLHNSCMKTNRMLESNNIQRINVPTTEKDITNNPYTNQFHEHMNMDVDKSTNFNIIKPHMETRNMIDTTSSHVNIAFNDVPDNMKVVDGINDVSQYVDMSMQDRLDDIQGV